MIEDHNPKLLLSRSKCAQLLGAFWGLRMEHFFWGIPRKPGRIIYTNVGFRWVIYFDAWGFPSYLAIGGTVLLFAPLDL